MALYVAKLALPSAERARLATRWAPAHYKVFLTHITLAYGIPRSYRVPRRPLSVDVYGEHKTHRTQALLCLVDGKPLREDGKPFHITYSTDRDVPPKEAGDITADMVAFLDDPTEYISFRLRPVVQTASIASWTPIDRWAS